MNRKRITTLFLFLALSVFVPLASSADARQEMRWAARAVITAEERNEIEPASLGEWGDAIESTLFLLVRTTELSRGPIRILVVKDDGVRAEFLPNDAFLVSSGLLDYADEALFERISTSSRSARNSESERMAIIAPFLAPEVAHFALDHPFEAWIQSGMKNFAPTDDQILAADRFAAVLLDQAGFGEGAMESYLRNLASRNLPGTVSPAMATWLSGRPSAEKRLESMLSAEPNISRISAEFKSAIRAIKTRQALKEAGESLAALEEIYPTGPYVSRLAALAAHERWLSSVEAERGAFPVYLPISEDAPPDISVFLSKLASEGVDAKTEPAMAKKAAPDLKSLETAIAAYQRAIGAFDDPALESSYATLLAQASPKKALEAAQAAASREREGGSYVAWANFATILFSTGSDKARALTIIDSAITQSKTPKRDGYLDVGMPGDERTLRLTKALMVMGKDGAKAARDAVLSAYSSPQDSGEIELRKAKIGDSVDDLVERWGRPSSIVYDYYSETWTYDSLVATVTVSKKKVERVRLGLGSPISPGGDVRCGDGQADFERFFGAPAYRANDGEVYLRGKSRITVFYLAGKIRSITIGS